MKAATVWQPWASLIAIGAKPYEFRGHKPPCSIIGQRIAIHAGARRIRRKEVIDLLNRMKRLDGPPPCLLAEIAIPFLKRVLLGLDEGLFSGDDAYRPPLSAIVCTAVLGEPKSGDRCGEEFGWSAIANDSDRDGTFNWGWPMLDVEPVVPPIEARGAQGFWNCGVVK